MWVIMPVKAFKDAKLRLTGVLSPTQRAHLSFLMLDDILLTLSTSPDVQGITLISSDKSVEELARRYQSEFLLTDLDRGYSQDAHRGVISVGDRNIDTVAIIPSDVPYLSHEDLAQLNLLHNNGMTICPAVVDGGTNALLFTPPLQVQLQFGVDSLRKYQNAAELANIPIQLKQIPGLEHDIDRPEDLHWFQAQTSGAEAWSYMR
ncbi:MAG: 2-phospho-L-lactate guanylyltransferase, partial [Gammaproteobacteria bacterium]